MTSRRKQYFIVEHLWRLGRWSLGLAMIVAWGAPISVFVIYTLMGIYEQFHGKICRMLESMLHYTKQHNEWD